MNLYGLTAKPRDKETTLICSEAFVGNLFVKDLKFMFRKMDSPDHLVYNINYADKCYMNTTLWSKNSRVESKTSVVWIKLEFCRRFFSSVLLVVSETE